MEFALVARTLNKWWGRLGRDDFTVDIRLDTVVCSKSSFCRILDVSNGLVIAAHDLFGDGFSIALHV